MAAIFVRSWGLVNVLDQEPRLAEEQLLASTRSKIAESLVGLTGIGHPHRHAVSKLGWEDSREILPRTFGALQLPRSLLHCFRIGPCRP